MAARILPMLFLGTVPAHGQSGGRAGPVEGAQLPKGTVEFGAILGSTLPVTWLHAHGDRRLTMVSLEAGRVMTNRIGPGPLAGSLEVLFEMTPLVLVHEPADVLGLTASPLHLRWNFRPWLGRHLGVFAEGSAGVVYTNHAVPVTASSSLSFIEQAGFGLRIGTGSRVEWLAGYRFQHISNGGRVEPNPGANFNFVYIGLTLPR